MNTLKSAVVFCVFLATIAFLPRASLSWIKPMDPATDPVPDVDKTEPDLSCYLATAANMLAGAGYGSGSTAQERAQSIYDELVAEFGGDT